MYVWLNSYVYMYTDNTMSSEKKTWGREDTAKQKKTRSFYTISIFRCFFFFLFLNQPASLWLYFLRHHWTFSQLYEILERCESSLIFFFFLFLRLVHSASTLHLLGFFILLVHFICAVVFLQGFSISNIVLHFLFSCLPIYIVSLYMWHTEWWKYMCYSIYELHRIQRYNLPFRIVFHIIENYEKKIDELQPRKLIGQLSMYN